MRSLLIEESLDVDVLAEFFYFVNERHEIYRRRFLQKLPAPWTKDKTLQTTFITNVYRELDIGTQYLTSQILNRGSEVEECFEILVYRQFNNRYTYEYLSNIGREYGDWSDWRWIANELLTYSKKQKLPVFSMAHMTTSLSYGGMPTKIEAACLMLHDHWRFRQKIHHYLMGATSLKDLVDRIATLSGYGTFLGYEVATDFGYSQRLQRFFENDWANPGPGCKKAIDLIVPERKSLKIPYEDVIDFLWSNQQGYFDALAIEFQYLNNKDLSKRNIEHSLCEYFKYHRAKYKKHVRRRYNDFSCGKIVKALDRD